MARRAVEAKGGVGPRVLEAASTARGAGREVKGAPPRKVGRADHPAPWSSSYQPPPRAHRQKLGRIV